MERSLDEDEVVLLIAILIEDHRMLIESHMEIENLYMELGNHMKKESQTMQIESHMEIEDQILIDKVMEDLLLQIEKHHPRIESHHMVQRNHMETENQTMQIKNHHTETGSLLDEDHFQMIVDHLHVREERKNLIRKKLQMKYCFLIHQEKKIAVDIVEKDNICNTLPSPTS